MDLGSSLGHLTYCTNIHAADHLPDVMAGLQAHLPTIKAGFAPHQAMGVGLRISKSAAQSLRNPDALAQMQELLAAHQCYVYTINGFPYGAFHGERVKEAVYQPDWAEQERLAYSNDLADQLAVMLPDGLEGTISTVPGSFKPWIDAQGIQAQKIADRLIAHVAHLVALKESTGKSIAMTLEPEPFCFLETIAETVAYFKSHLFSKQAVTALSQQTGFNAAQAEAALVQHLGVCYDVCHAAVEYEDPKQSILDLQNAGIRIPKIQLSSALKVMDVTRDSAEHLMPFDEPVYLHQVYARRNEHLKGYQDLPEALADIQNNVGAEWRVHFHVPIFLNELQDFGTTQDFLKEILRLHRQAPITEHLEVETYTWDVLPETYRNVGVGQAIARELNWVKGELAS